MLLLTKPSTRTTKLKLLEQEDPLPRNLDHGWMQMGGKTYCFLGPCAECPLNSSCSRKSTKISLAGNTINIRSAIRARPGYVLVAIDYQQIEMRVAANLSNESVWIDAILAGRDLHTEMGSRGFKKPFEEVTKKERGLAKTQNFGNLFGGSPYTLSRQSGLSIEEAEVVYRAWWAAVPNMQSWVAVQHARVFELGFIKTFHGRQRDMSSLLREMKELELKGDRTAARKQRGFIERTSVNTPVQGSAADIMKIALVRVHNWIKKEGLEDQIHMLLPVHDEQVFEVRDDGWEETAFQIAERMLFPIKSWRLPMGVDIEYGPNWGDLQTLKMPADRAAKAVGLDSKPVADKEVPRAIEDSVTLKVNATLTSELARVVNTAIEGSQGVQKLFIVVEGQKWRGKSGIKVNGEELKRLLAPTKGLLVQEGKPD